MLHPILFIIDSHSSRIISQKKRVQRQKRVYRHASNARWVQVILKKHSHDATPLKPPIAFKILAPCISTTRKMIYGNTQIFSMMTVNNSNRH
jgi:hypothetical protein